MEVHLEISLVLFFVFSVLVICQLCREREFVVINEKMCALIFGISFGACLYFSNSDFSFSGPSTIRLLPIVFILEKVHNMPRSYIYNSLGSLALLSIIGGGISMLITSWICHFAISLASVQLPFNALMKLSIAMTIPGDFLMIDQDNSYLLFQHISLFYIFWAFPLFFALDAGFKSFIGRWLFGFALGSIFGVVFSLILRLTSYAKIWSIIEVLASTLVSLIAYSIAKVIGADEYISLLTCCTILVKYAFITDTSLVIRNKALISATAVSEILCQIWLGVNLWSDKILFNLFPIFSVFIVVPICCYLTVLVLGRLLKLRGINIKDCIYLTFAGFKSSPTIGLTSFIHPDLMYLALFFTIFSDIISLIIEKYSKTTRNEGNYIISSTTCSKLKTFLQNLEESYIIPVFLKEKQEVSILSPKFNTNSQRLDPGIQIRQIPRDEASRELQALNLNITESEIQGSMQLK